MEEKKLVPKLRFPGFTEPWEQRKLGEILVERNQQFPMDCEYPLMAFIANEGVAPKGERYDRSALVTDSENKLYKRTELGDFIYSSNNLETGSIGLNKFGNACISPVYSIFKSTEIGDPKFLGRRLVRKDIINAMIRWRQGVIYGQWRIHESDFLKIIISIPLIEEQREIGMFLTKVDTLITLHQRKLEHLKLKKKSLLQKLFPKEGEVNPELRFPGFTDPWEQRKLGEIVERVTRKNNGQSDRPLTISAQDGLVDQCEYFDRQVASRDMSNYYLIKKGEFAYNKSYSDGYPFGAIKRLDYYDKGALSTLYIIFKIVDDRIGSDFMVAYYMTSLWYKEISKRAAEGARNHGLLNISTEDFFNSELKIPNDIKEQIKVGKFVNQFDQYITLHQRKLEHLQLLKKALLQQLFV